MLKKYYREFTLLALFLAAVVGFWGFSGSLAVNNSEAEEKEHATPAYLIQVVDGDTVWLGIVTKVRISNIDTPETYRPKCSEEKELGLRATAMVRQLIPKGSLVFLRELKGGKDKYRRTLARVVISNGRDIGETLVARGLAKPWQGKRHNWCEELQKKEDRENREEDKAHAPAD